MPNDIFDTIAPDAPATPQGDIFDQVSPSPSARLPQDNTLLGHARAYTNTKYVFGGQDACRGADCSFFTQDVMKKMGVNVPRTAADQYTQGARVDLKNLQPGDLVFKQGTYKPGISHVGVVLPNGTIANMKSSKTGYQEEPVQKWLSDPHTVGARRFLAGQPAVPQSPQNAMYERSTSVQARPDVGGAMGAAVGDIAGTGAGQDANTSPPSTVDFTSLDAQKAYMKYRAKFLQPGDQSDPANLAVAYSLVPPNERATRGGLSDLLKKMDPVGQAAILDRAQELWDEDHGKPSMRAERTNQRPPGLLERIANAPAAAFSYAGAPGKLAAYELSKGVESLVGGKATLPGDVAENKRLDAMNPAQRMMALKDQPLRSLGRPETEGYNQKRDVNQPFVGRLLDKAGATALDVGTNPITVAAGALGAAAQLPGASALVRGTNLAANTAFSANMASGLAQTKDPVDWLIGLPMAALGVLGTAHAAKALKARGVTADQVSVVAELKQRGVPEEEIRKAVKKTHPGINNKAAKQSGAQSTPDTVPSSDILTPDEIRKLHEDLNGGKPVVREAAKPSTKPPAVQEAARPPASPSHVELPTNGEYVPTSLEKQSPIEANVYRARSTSDTPSGSSRYGNGTYSTTSESVAGIFAEHRGEGAKVEAGKVRLERPFVDTTPDTSTPEYQNLRHSLIDEGMKPAAIDGAASGNARHGLFQAGARFLADKYKDEPNLFPGTERMRQKVEKAGYDGIVGHTQNSPDLPNHVEIVEFRKPLQTENVARATPEPLTGAKNAVVEAEREARGLPAVERQDYTKIADAHARATAMMDDGVLDARQVAEEVSGKPRPLNATEVAALAIDRAKLSEQHASITNAIEKAIDAGDTESIDGMRASLKHAEEAFDRNDQALVKGGREQSAAFNARKIMINEDRSLAAVLQRAKVKKGAALTDAERAAFENLVKQNEKLTADMVAQEARHKADIAAKDEAISKAASVQALRKVAAREELTAGRSVRRATKQDLNKEFGDLVASLKPKPRDGSGKLNAGLPLGERYEHIDIIPTFKKMAANLQKRGKVNAEEIAQTIHTAAVEHLPSLTVREVRDAISGYGRTVNRTASEAAKQMRDLQKQMSLISSIEDAEKGVQPAKGNAPGKPSAKVASLRKRLDATMEATGTKPKVARDKMTATQRTLNARQAGLEKDIAALDAQIKAGARATETAKATVADTPEIAAMKAERAAKAAQLEKIAPKPAAVRDPLPAIKKRTAAQIEELQRKLKEGDYLPTKSRLPVRPDYELQQMRVKQKLLDKALRKKINSMEKTPILQRIGEHALGAQRGLLTTGIGTFEHLSGMSLARLILTPMEEGVGGVLSKVPGIKTIADIAPRQGGFNLKAEGKAIAALKDVPREALNELRGMSNLEAKYGTPHESNLPAIYDIPGRTHNAFKTPAVLAEWARSFVKRAAHAEKIGLDVGTPEVQQSIGEAAYLDAMAAKLQQPNEINDSFSNMLKKLDKGGFASRAVSFGLKAALPIRRIPMNYAAEMVDYLPGGGLAKGAAVLMEARRAGRITPEQADSIMKSWKKQGVGAAAALMLAYGILRAGGTFKNQGKKQPGDLEPGEVEFLGHKMNSHFSRSTLGVGLNALADFQHGFDKKRYGDEAGLTNALARAATGAVMQVPFAAETARVGSATENPNSLGKYAGNIAKGFLIPRGVQELATMQDKDAAGKQIVRKTRGFRDMFKAGIPGQRETLPARNAVQSLGSADVVTELERLGITKQAVTGAMKLRTGEKVQLSPIAEAAMQKRIGERMTEALQGLLKSDGYKGMSDTNRVKVIDRLFKNIPAGVRNQYKAPFYSNGLATPAR